jgi:hypothetical protein
LALFSEDFVKEPTTYEEALIVSEKKTKSSGKMQSTRSSKKWLKEAYGKF